MAGGFCATTVGIWKFIGEIIYIIRIVIPILIVLLGTIDLGKAVLAGEEKTVKEAQKSFIKRLIYGVAIFFIFTIVEVIFGLLGVNTDKGDTKICWDCATKPHSKVCSNYINNYAEIEGIDYSTDDDYYDEDSDIDETPSVNNDNSGLDEL